MHIFYSIQILIHYVSESEFLNWIVPKQDVPRLTCRPTLSLGQLIVSAAAMIGDTQLQGSLDTEAVYNLQVLCC